MRTKIKRGLFFSLGLFFIVLAIAGVMLPLLPTTPFLLLAAMFFAESSPRTHQWLLNNRHFGPIIRNWEQFRCIPGFAKKLSFMMIAVFGASSIYVIPILWVKLLTITLIAYALYFIRNIPTCLEDQEL
jgi:uncharacterized protein